MKAVDMYNGIVFDICHEEVSIGTSYSEGTSGWNLRDMVSEIQYLLDLWNDPDCDPYQDAHDETQAPDKPWYRQWKKEKERMRRFIEKHKDEALTMECFEAHGSKYD